VRDISQRLSGEHYNDYESLQSLAMPSCVGEGPVGGVEVGVGVGVVGSELVVVSRVDVDGDVGSAPSQERQ
jgi:hypothetical protein